MSEARQQEGGASIIPMRGHYRSEDAEIIQMPERTGFRPRSLADSSIPTPTLSERLFELLKPHELRREENERIRAESIVRSLLVSVEMLPPEASDTVYPVETKVADAWDQLYVAREKLDRADFRELFMDLADSLPDEANDTNIMRAAAAARKRLNTVFGDEMVDAQRVVYLLLRDDFNQQQ